MKIAINQLILDQSFEFVIMLCAGMTVMLFHDLFLMIKNKLKPRNSISFIQDILFWLFASILTSSFLYYCSFGRISVHAAIAFGIGAVLWKKFFCGIMNPR
ncbi:spore cortex biosynthesis protein YabQ [Sinanaerobacter chloroacetimidivorans]|jgi:uncharacterized membrane protein (DUF373 family)|uniref:Spore cortex biosynthesis protein YabQ n=1 Tax=Sinanaerobacter chloroacetimidivorans TaxID=2818044 RepID=A0A8J7W3B1_9FIRM|nr:spore cortex biosynthesis protein YabQ [Sinanaerobacter chloroacetimidivorans]MBR0598321.1 spore cortex biosynthesis protein YabQ [Sinanaerobacter chloroacetimidivorans]